MATRLLIINQQLGFSVRTKQALEEIGGFEVSPFTTADAALEYLNARPHHVVLLDFTLPNADGADVVRRLRRVQPEIAIIASPDLPEVATFVRSLNLEGLIDVPCSARALIPVIKKAITGSLDALPDTAQAPIINETRTEPVTTARPQSPDFTSLDSVLVRLGGLEDEVGTSTLDVDTGDTDKLDNAQTIEFVIRGDELPRPPQSAEDIDAEIEDAVGLFRQLAAEEPPMPSLEESGTVGDLKRSMEASNLYDIAERVLEDHTHPTDAIITSAERQSDVNDNSTAQLILKSTEDDTSGEQVSDDMAQLIDEISSQFEDDVEERPGWVKDIERYVREPDFLIDLPQQAERPKPESKPNAPPRTLPGEKAPPPTLPEEKPIAATTEDEPTPPPPQELPALPENINTDDPRVAQMALSLTKASLESTAQAVLLVKGDDVVAYAGDMLLEDMAKLHDTIAGDWDAPPGDTRIRFATLPENGQDYMLYSRKTEGDFTLSMIFTGTLPLRVIRQQSDKLIDALEEVPLLPPPSTSSSDLETIDELYALEDEAAQEEEEALQSTTQLIVAQNANKEATGQMPAITEQTPPVEDIIEPRVIKPAEDAVLMPYTYLWMLRDPERALSQQAAQNIVFKLDQWLSSIGWNVKILQVYEDYVYLLADVPEEGLANEIIADLKDFTAQVVEQTDPITDLNKLWAEGYFVLTPGRELKQDEIQQFINFERMR